MEEAIEAMTPEGKKCSLALTVVDVQLLRCKQLPLAPVRQCF